MLQLDAAATRDRLPFPRLVEALADMFAQGCTVPPRHHHTFETGGTPGTLLLMPAWRAGAFLGVKLVTVVPDNARRGEAALSSLYLLSDAATGRPLALIDGDTLTARRTAAASALAARHLARPEAKRLLVVGSGRVARLLPAAYRAVRRIEEVRVWNRTPARAEALAEELRADGFAADAVTDLAAAVAAADIVTCATLATEPVIQGEWLRPGTHLDLIGAFRPHMREADETAVLRSSLFVDTPEALEEAGELVQPLKAGRLAPEAVRATLADLCAGRHPGRRTADEITLFKSVGTALEDLAAATLAYAAS